MALDSLSDLNRFPISTSQQDLRDRVSDVFSLIENEVAATNRDFVQAFIDVISYQSYAGNLPTVSEYRILDWIETIYDELEPGLVEVLADLYLCMSTGRAYREIISRLESMQDLRSEKYLIAALEEFRSDSG